MIKYYKISLGNTNEVLSGLSKKIKDTFQNDAIIVAEDKNRVYYQSCAGSSQPILIGNIDKYIRINTSAGTWQVLKPNTNYYLNNTGYQFNLPTLINYPQLSDGDVINLYFSQALPNDVEFKLGNNIILTIPKEHAKNNHFKLVFDYSGNVWTPLTASVVQGADYLQVPIAKNDHSDYGIVSYIDGIAAFNTYAGLKTSLTGTWKNSDDVVEASAIYRALTGSLAAISADLYTTKEIDATILSTHLPSATTEGDWGITTIENAYTKELISASPYPIAASAVYNYVKDNVEDYTSSSISGIQIRKADGTNFSPVVTASVTNRVANLETIILSGYTKADISGSPKPIAASAVYNYVSANVDSYTSSAISAITYNGNTITGENRVAALGTMSTQINGVDYGATTSNLINLGSDWVQITLGGVADKGGWYVQKTADGYRLNQGIATLSSTVTSITNYVMTVTGNAIPVMLKTNLDNLYPIEKGTLSADGGNFKIDVRPYLIYDGSASFTGPWYVYYGGGINDIYTTANIVQSVLIESSDTPSKNIYFGSGDVAIITTNSSSPATVVLQFPPYDASTCPNGLPTGHGMIIKIDNAGGKIIQFAGRTVVASTGTYSFSIFNFGTAGGGIQQVGEVTNVYPAQAI